MDNKPIVFFVSLMLLTLALVVVFQIKTDPFGNASAKTEQMQADPHLSDTAIKLFADNCARCHGSFGEGKGRNPSLRGVNMSHEQIAQRIRTGKGKMPAFKNLSDEQIHLLVSLIEKM